MNTFRRPMFRGGPVDSRGTGITSGLSYAKGGRVGLRFGGSPFGAPIPPGSALSQPTGIGTAQVYQRPIGPPTGGLKIPKGFRNIKGTPSLKMLGTQTLRNLALPSLSTTALMALPFLPSGIMAAANMPKTDAALQFMKGKSGELSPQEQFTFDETNIDVGDFYDELSRKNKEGTPISTMDAFLLDPETGTYPKFMGRIEDREKRAAIEKAKTGKQTENPLDDEGKALSADQLKILELEKLIEGMTKVEPKAKDTDMEESIEIDKEKFAKALGRDKARGQDISDMLLSFSSKALAPDATVKSAFAEFAADEVKRPSRVRKIDDSAAALAINKYIKGEISRAEADQYIKRIELTQKLRDESNVKTAAEYIQAADEAGFVKKVKVGLNSYYAQEGVVPKYEVVKSKDMDDPEKFKFSQDDVGVIFIEEDTREVYTFDSTGKKQPIINM